VFAKPSTATANYQSFMLGVGQRIEADQHAMPLASCLR